MKKENKKKNIIVFFCFAFLLFLSKSVSADIGQLTTDSMSSAIGNFTNYYQSLGTEISGNLSEVDLYLMTTYPTYYGTFIGVQIVESDDNILEVTDTNVWTQIVNKVNTSNHDGLIVLNNPDNSSDLTYNFNSSKYYFLKLIAGTSDGGGIYQYTYFYGNTDASSYSNGAFYTDTYINDLEFNMVGLNSTPVESCSDGIQNQDETGIDIGGVCATITRLYHISPVISSTTAGLTFDIVYRYYVNSATDPDLTKISITACPKSYTIDDCDTWYHDVTFDELVEVTDSYTATYSGLTEVSVATWNNQYNKTCAWWQFTCKPESARYGAGDIWTFNVQYESGTNGIPAVITDDIYYKPDSPSSCAIATFDGMDCLIEVFKYAFIPSSETFSRFTEIKETISRKPPFGYITIIFDDINDIANNPETATFTLESLTPINSLIFDPIRLGLQWILYFAFAFALFHRFKDIQI